MSLYDCVLDYVTGGPTPPFPSPATVPQYTQLGKHQSLFSFHNKRKSRNIVQGPLLVHSATKARAVRCVRTYKIALTIYYVAYRQVAYAYSFTEGG